MAPVMKQSAWESLGPVDRAIVLAAMDRARIRHGVFVRRIESELLEGLKLRGINVVNPDKRAFSADARRRFLGADDAEEHIDLALYRRIRELAR